MCPECKQTHGHFWWCHTARFKRQTYKIVEANHQADGYYVNGSTRYVRYARSQKHLNPKLLAKHGGKLVKI